MTPSNTTTEGLQQLIETGIFNHLPICDVCITPVVNGTTAQVFVDTGEGMVELPSQISHSQVQQWALGLMNKSGRSWDAKYPFMDFRHIDQCGAWRVHIAFQPASVHGPSISLRRLSVGSSSARNWQPTSHFELLKKAVDNKESILIAGATGSGKTTLLSDLLGYAAASERILVLEDTPEISTAHPHVLNLSARPPNSDGMGEITLRHLVRESLRMRPDRIILGECRGGEVLDLLQSLNTGHRGSLATLHANSARDALRRLELLCYLQATNPPPHSIIRDLIVHGVQWVVHLRRNNGSRVISEILRIEGREGDTILARPMLD